MVLDFRLVTVLSDEGTYIEARKKARKHNIPVVSSTDYTPWLQRVKYLYVSVFVKS